MTVVSQNAQNTTFISFFKSLFGIVIVYFSYCFCSDQPTIKLFFLLVLIKRTYKYVKTFPMYIEHVHEMILVHKHVTFKFKDF